MSIANVDYPNLYNPYTQIDTYVAAGANGAPGQWLGATNFPGQIATLPPQIFAAYTGFSSNYAPAITALGTTATSTSVTSLTSTENLVVGMLVTGSGVAAGTTISAITSSTAITLSAATSSSVTLNQLTFYYPSTNIPNGFPPVFKYVRYLSQSNQSLNAYPGIVYYADSTGTTVTGYAGEAYGVTTNNASVPGNALAGVLLYNTTSSGLSGSAAAAALNGNWCWIQVGGLCPAMKAIASCVIGDSLSASVSNTAAFTVVRTAGGTANPYTRYLGTVWSNLSSNTTCDVLINPLLAIS